MQEENYDATENIQWTKLNTCSTNICTHKLFIDDTANNASFKYTKRLRNSYLLLMFIPVILMAAYRPNPAKGGLMALIVLLVVFTVGLCFLIKTMCTNIIFSKEIMAFYKATSHHKKCYDQSKLTNLVPFSEFKALQLLKFLNFSRGKCAPRYDCFQLNIVKNDNIRINIIAHGDYTQIKEDAKKLSEFINIPLIEKT